MSKKAHKEPYGKNIISCTSEFIVMKGENGHK